MSQEQLSGSFQCHGKDRLFSVQKGGKMNVVVYVWILKLTATRCDLGHNEIICKVRK